MTLPVVLTWRAEAQIEKAASWWRANRPKAPDALLEELNRAFVLLAHQPAIGIPARNVRLAGVRRIHLHRVRYYLYYQLLEDPAQIEILALWHASRAQAP